MADYNVMLGLELESDAIQKIENRIKNIKCESIKIDISISDDRVLNFIQDLSKANKDLANNLLTLNKIAKNTNEQQEKADKQKLDSAKDLSYVYKQLISIQKEINSSEIKLTKLDKNSKQFQTLSMQIDKLKKAYLDLYNLGSEIEGFDLNDNSFNKINNSLEKTQRQVESIRAALSDKQSLQELKKQEKELISLAQEKAKLRTQRTKLYNDTNKHDNELELLEQQINKIETAYNNLRNSLKKQLPTEQFEILKRKTQEIYDAEIFLRRRNVDITADRDTKQALNIKNNFDSGNIDSEYSKIESSLRSLNTVSKTTEENLNKLSQSYIALKNAIDTNNTKEIIKTYNQFEDALKKVNNELKQAAQLQKINESVYNLENSKKQFSNEINVWLSQNSSATKKFGLRIKTIQSQLESCNETSLDRLKDEFRDITQEATIAGKTGLNFIDTLKQKGKELASYYTISGSFYKIVDTAKQAYQNVANVDSAMTNLYKVTDNTDAEYSDFFQNAKQNAKDLGVTLTDYITATSEWSKLGYDINASSQLAKVSSIYQNVGEVDSETAVKDIVTALKAYNINVDDAISIVDKFNKLGNEFAVSSSSLGEGLKVSASSLAVAGNDINKSLAMLTGGGEITQDIGELGNGLKTISLRLRGMKGELQDIGEEYEDIESVSKIQTQIYNLTEGHTNIFNDDGSFKDTYDILESISEVYDKLSDTNKADLTEIMFGKNRANQGVAIIQAFQSGQIQKAYQAAQNSAGSAQEEQNKLLDSIEAKTNQLKSSLESLSTTIMDDKVIKFVIDNLTAIISDTDDLIKNITTLPVLLTAATTALLKYLDIKKGVGLFTVNKDESGNGVGISLFGKKTIGKPDYKVNQKFYSENFTKQLNNDIASLTSYIQSLQKGEQQLSSWSAYMNTASITAQEYAKTLNLTKIEEFDLSNATEELKIKSRESQVTLKAQSTTWKDVKNLIELYNGNLEDTVHLNKEQFVSAINQSNGALGGYLSKVEQGNASFTGYAGSLVKATAKTVALNLATTALDGIISALVIGGITLLVKSIDDYIHASEKAAEAAHKEAEEAKERLKKSQEETETLDELISKYEELGKKSVRDNSTNKELLDIQNQINEIIGKQYNNLDLVNGKYQEQLEVLKNIRNEKAEENYKNARESYITAKNDASKAVGEKNYGYDIAEYISSSEKSKSDIVSENKKIIEALNKAGLIGKATNKYDDASPYAFKSFSYESDESLNELGKKIGAYFYNEPSKDFFSTGTDYGLKLTGGNAADKRKWFQSAIDVLEKANLQDTELFNKLNSASAHYKEKSESFNNSAQSFIDSMIGKISPNDTINTLETYKKYREKLIKEIKNNNYYDDLISEGFLSDNANDTNSVESKVDAYLSTIYSEYSFEYKAQQNKLKSEVESTPKISFAELVGETVDKDGKTVTSEFAKNVDDYVEKVSNLQNTLTTIKENGKLESKDLVDLINKYPQLAGETDNLSEAITRLIKSENSDIIEKFNKQIDNLDTKESVNQMKKYLDTVLKVGEIVGNTDVSVNLSAEIENLDSLYSVIKESSSGTGLTNDSIDFIKNRFKNLDSYNAEELFEKTANGIHLNKKALQELESEYEKSQKKSIDKQLKDLKDDYQDVTDEIYNCTDAAKLADLYYERSKIVTEIDNVSQLASQYEGLTSSYNKWIKAQSSGEEGDMYDTIRNYMEDAKKLYDEGLVGTNVFREYVDLLSNKDLSAASPTEVRKEFERLKESISGTSYKATDFLAEGSDGVLNFLHALQEVNPEWAKLKDDGTWELNIDNDDAAKKLGIDVEFVESMLKKLTDYEWVVNLKGEYSDLKPLENTELTLENINNKISDAKQNLDSFKDSNGKINIKLEGAKEAQKELETLLKTKQAIVDQESGIYNVDTDINNYIGGYDRYGNISYYKDSNNKVVSKDYLTKVTAIYGLIESLNKNINDKKINLEIGADTTQADNAINKLYENLKGQNGNKTGKQILVSLGIDTSSKDAFLKSINNLIGSKDFQDKISKLGLGTVAVIDTEVDDKAVKDFEKSDKDTEGTVYYHADYSQVLDSLPPTLKAKLEVESELKSSNNPLSNVVKFFAGGLFGKSHANGSDGNAPSGTHLGAELGEEIIVRNGNYFTIGKDSAEFFKYKKGDIIFSAEQSRQLLENGKITSGKKRGKAFANGNSTGNGLITYKGNVKTKASGSSDKDKDSKSESKQVFDWIEILFKRLENAISKLDDTVNNTFKTWNERTKALFKEQANIRSEIDVQKLAQSRYTKEANSVGLSDYWKNRVNNGTIDISTIKDNDDLVEKIQTYQQWIEKANECRDAVSELNSKLSELAKTNFDNVSTQWDSILSRFERKKNDIEQNISQSETKGYITSTKYYSVLTSNERANIIDLRKKEQQQNVALNDAVNLGRIKVGSQAYNEMKSQIEETKSAIKESQTAILEYNKSIREANWSIFDTIQEKISAIADESDFLINLMDSDKLYDDKGQLTDEGNATMGLHGMNYNVYMEQSSKYAKEIKKIDKELAKDPYNQDLLERREDLLSKQRESISAAESEKDAIKDMVEEGINKELDALQKLIDKRNEALESAKDLYDYQKKIAEQTKNITDIQKQLSAYEGDTSEESKAKIQKLKTDLENAQSDLKDSEYDKYVSDQQKMLDNLYDDYEKILNERLDDVDALVQDMIDNSNKNAESIINTIQSQSKDVGYTVSKSITDVWNNGIPLSTYKNGVTNSLTGIKSSLATINTNILNAIKVANDNANRNMGILPDYGFFQQGGNMSGRGDNSKDINNNLVSRMRYFGIDTKYGAYYWQASGLKKKYGEDWKGYANVKQSKALLEWMKVNGYASGSAYINSNQLAWTQEKGQEVIIRPSDGAILTPLFRGDGVLNADATKNLYSLTNDPTKFIKDNFKLNIPSIPSTSNGNTFNNDMSFEINLPNVTNYEQFIYTMQRDKRFEKIVQSMTTSRVIGKSSLNKFTIK